ncbi:hypothetical protein HK102_009739 [Quaeritorhiza haematococci]|nr:hypothetical protein HK102_009739 [Quaeritorhiza haematococci]
MVELDSSVGNVTTDTASESAPEAAGRYFNKKLVSRVSLQLTFAIVVAEFLFLAFAFTVPPAFLGLYGYESTEATCCAIESGGGGAGSSSAVLQASSSGKQESTIKTIQISRSVPRQTTDDVLRQLASRIIFYPLIPLIGQLFNIIADVYTYQTHKQSFEILLISYIGTSIQGTLTAIVFFAIDPAWRKIRHEIVSQHPALGGVLYFWWCGRSRKEAVKKQTASVGTSSKSGVTAPWSGADSPAASLSGTKTTSGGVFDGSLGNGAAIGLEGGGNPRTINVIMNTIDLDNQLESLLNAAASTKPELTPSEKVDKLMPVPISTARTAISPSTPSPSSQYSSSSGPPPSTPPTPTAKLIKSPSSSNKLSPTVSTVSPPPRTHSKSPRTRRVDLM